MKNLQPLHFGIASLCAFTIMACGAPPASTSASEGSTPEGSTIPRAPAPRPSQLGSEAVKSAGTGGAPLTVGSSSGDFNLQAPAGDSIYYARGSFPAANIASANDSVFGTNSYSLQLNTNTFYINPNICLNHPPASQDNSCVGWEQFVYQNINGVAHVFIEYWLIDVGTTVCPSGWTPFSQVNSDGNRWNYCFMDSARVPAPAEPITSIASLSVSGTVGTGAQGNIASFSTGSGNPVVATGPDFFTLATGGYGGHYGWEVAEYNVFGAGNGGEVSFPLASSLSVNISADYGTAPSNLSSAAPTCGTTSETGETNNTLLTSCTASPGVFSFFNGKAALLRMPSIQFSESVRFGIIHF